jgi:hypothetical protein
MSRLFGLASCGFEEVVVFFIGEQVADLPDCLPKLIVGVPSRMIT